MESKDVINATCPECRGPLTLERHNGILEFQCLVGHRYSPRALLQAHSETQERTLWSAVVVLEETTNLVECVAGHLPAQELSRLRQQAEIKRQQANEIRNILEKLEPFHTG